MGSSRRTSLSPGPASLVVSAKEASKVMQDHDYLHSSTVCPGETSAKSDRPVPLMYRTLSVSEILREICSHSTNKSLAALARTCKTFYDTAMDMLWAKIHNIDPLLGCVERLHPRIYPGVPKYSWRSWSTGVQPLSKRETTQFLRHASRVRSLSINGYRDGAPLIAHYHLHLLSVLPIETCMFPNLLSLSWMVQPPDSRLFPLFLSPTLRHCYLLNVHCDLKPIARRCDVLESLAVASANTPMTTRDITMLSDTVRSCKRLAKLRCPPLNSAAWKYLSNLPTLVTLTINGPGADDLLGQDNFSPFLNLKTLSVYLGILHLATANNITTFIRHSEFPSLKEFHLQATNDLPWRKVEQLLGTLSQCNACQTLECAEIYFSDSLELEHVANPLPVVRQFLSFTQLRRLWLDINGSISLDNDLLLEAMSSWPHIESLELDDQHHYQPAVTFHGLFTALRKCPHLHNLRIFMDAVNIDIDPKAELFQHPSLRILHLGVSPVRDAEAVAVIISSMLPHVGEVMYHENVGENCCAWGEVNKHLAG